MEFPAGSAAVAACDKVAGRHWCRHNPGVGWIAEMIVQGIWEGFVEVAYRKWGWLGGVAAFLLPPLLAILVIWALVR